MAAERFEVVEAAASLPAGVPPEEYVIILPDWDGGVSQAIGLQDPDQAAGVVVLDAAGEIVGLCQGENLAKATLAMLARIAPAMHNTFQHES